MRVLRRWENRIIGLLVSCGISLIPKIVFAVDNPFSSASTIFRRTRDQAGVGGASLEEIIGNIIQGALSLVGVIFLILAVYAGYKWMTAQGDPDKITKAKDTLTAAIIGLAITLAAYAITAFVISKFIESGMITQ